MTFAILCVGKTVYLLGFMLSIALKTLNLCFSICGENSF